LAQLVGAAAMLMACSAPEGDTQDSGQVDTIDEGPPCVKIDPLRIEFERSNLSEGAPGEVRTVTVSNACEGTLEIRSVELLTERVEGSFQVGRVSTNLLSAGASTTFDIRFTPPLVGEHQGRFGIRTNDPADPRMVGWLSGHATGPILAGVPDEHILDPIPVGCSRTWHLQLINHGNADLDIEQLDIFSESGEFRVRTGGDVPTTLAPYAGAQAGPVLDVWVDYLPIDSGVDLADLTIDSSDPVDPRRIVRLTGTATFQGSSSEQHEQPADPVVDVLLTVDRSASSERLDALQAELGALVDVLRDGGVDYHLAAVVADDGCVVGSTRIINGSLTRSQAVDALVEQIDLDRALADVGVHTSSGLRLAEAALSAANTAPDGCNAGLFREGAWLSTVHLSELDDQSPSPWSYYRTILESHVDRPQDLRVSAIAPDHPEGCEGLDPASAYHTAATSTGGQLLSICEPDPARTWHDAAVLAGRPPTHVLLGEQPAARTIRVQVDGVPLTHGWTYEPSINAVSFDASTTPSAGSRIDIDYHHTAECAR